MRFVLSVHVGDEEFVAHSYHATKGAARLVAEACGFLPMDTPEWDDEDANPPVGAYLVEEVEVYHGTHA